MKKKLVLLCLLLCSLFGMVACSADEPYTSMTITSTVTEDVVQLEIKESYDAYNQKIYLYDSYSFNVTVADSNKETDLGVTVVESTGYVNAVVEYQGAGVSRITVTPTGYNNTGRVSMKVMTNEGNKHLDVVFNIDLK